MFLLILDFNTNNCFTVFPINIYKYFMEVHSILKFYACLKSKLLANSHKVTC